MNQLPILGPAHKGLGNCHCVLTSKNLKQTEKSTSLLRSVGEVRSQGKLLSLQLEKIIDECRKSLLTGAAIHEQTPSQEPGPG